jgi:hypothetical protein
MTARKKEPKNNLRLALLFAVILAFFIFISLSFRVFFLVKESKYDGQHSFNIEYRTEENTSFASFSPGNKSISVLRANAAFDVQVPIDATIYDSFNSSNISLDLIKSAINLKKSENLTSIDALRLAIFARSVPADFISTRELSANNSDMQNQENLLLTFNEKKLVDEGKTIEIVNATSVSGLGSRLENFISLMGGNVILVKSQEGGESEIRYFGEESYTLNRINEFLKFKTVKVEERDVADIVIIIGEEGRELPL